MEKIEDWPKGTHCAINKVCFAFMYSKFYPSGNSGFPHMRVGLDDNACAHDCLIKFIHDF